MAEKSQFFGDNLYTVLGLATDASHSEIKKSYQELVLKFHPDKFDPKTAEYTCEEARDYFYCIDKAWKTLGNHESRAKYDATLRDIQVTQEWPVDAEVDLSEMNYDEDYGHYTWPCRCSGSYSITEENLERRENITCCSTCTLSIRILYKEENY